MIQLRGKVQQAENHIIRTIHVNVLESLFLSTLRIENDR